MTREQQAAEAREALRRACRNAMTAGERYRRLGTTKAARDAEYADGQLQGVAWMCLTLDILSPDEVDHIEAQYGIFRKG